MHGIWVLYLLNYSFYYKRVLAHNSLYELNLRCQPLPVSIQKNNNGFDLTLNLVDSHIHGATQNQRAAGEMPVRISGIQNSVYHSIDPPFTAIINCIWTWTKAGSTGNENGVLEEWN